MLNSIDQPTTSTSTTNSSGISSSTRATSPLTTSSGATNVVTPVTRLTRSVANCSRRHHQFTLLVTNNITTVITKINVNGLFSSDGSVLKTAPLGSFLAFLYIYINIVTKLTVLVPKNLSHVSFGQHRPCMRSFCAKRSHDQRLQLLMVNVINNVSTVLVNVTIAICTSSVLNISSN